MGVVKDGEEDGYMNIVFELCTAYERQSYIEGLKVGGRLMVELMEVFDDTRQDTKSPTTTSSGGLILALIRAMLLLAPKGGVASIITGPLTKRYPLNLLF